MAAQYQLSAELVGHEEDVRGVCAIVDSQIATASRDKTVRIWRRANGGSPSFQPANTLVGHTHFVSSVAYVTPGIAFPGGALISGGMDKKVLVWDVENATILQTLTGHTEVITDVAAAQDGSILSSSQDKTVRVWRQGQCVATLVGHDSAVQAVLAVPGGDVVTGSSDCTIKLWKGSSCIHTAKGHNDTVRGLALVEGLGVASASHDGSVRVWAQSGEQLLEMVGHTALVYSVAAHGTEIASCSEDGTARVWQDGLCQQVLEHPGCVWDVAYMPNGDLVTGCSDGIARVWSRDASRAAEPDVLQSFQARMAATIKSKTVGGVKLEDLPGPEVLEQPGRRDGQHKIIREGNTGIAYAWSSREYKWEKIGEVVDGPTDPLEKRTFHGVLYDYVFDVDIGDGVPARKLPYNRGDNPYVVAERWLEQEELPAGYREQIVQFIVQNAGPAMPVPDNTFSDPYTGGQAYQPGQPGPGQSSVPSVPSASSSKLPGVRHIPQKVLLLFESAQFDGILKKLLEFNAQASSDNVLSEQEQLRLQELADSLRDPQKKEASTLSDQQLQALRKMLTNWPSSHLFPALDLLRLLPLHPEPARVLAEEAGKEGGAKDILLKSIRRSAEGSPPVSLNQLMGVRAAVNAFRQPVLRPWLRRYLTEILDLFSSCAKSTTKNVRLAWASFVLNVSVMLVEAEEESEQIQALSAAIETAGPDENESDVRALAMLAVGTLIYGGKVTEVAKDLDVEALVEAAKKSSHTRLAEIGADIEALLKS